RPEGTRQRGGGPPPRGLQHTSPDPPLGAGAPTISDQMNPAPPVTSTRLDTASPCQSQRGHSSALKAKPGYHLDKKRQILSFPKNLAQPSGDAGEREIARRNRVVALQDLVARHLFRNARRVREERPLLGTGLAVRIAVTRDRRH